jgi:hypothetical protein
MTATLFTPGTLKDMDMTLEWAWRGIVRYKGEEMFRQLLIIFLTLC